MTATTVTIATTATIAEDHEEALAMDLAADLAEVAEYLEDFVEVATVAINERKGHVAFYTASNRHMTLLEEGTTRYDEAITVATLRQQGLTMNAIVEVTGFSKPKCRRLLNEVLLLDEVNEALAAAQEEDEALLAA